MSSPKNPKKQGIKAENTPQRTSEKLIITSGLVVIIDQFMLANSQFLDLFEETKLEEIVGKYGGHTYELEIGDYRVYRDPIELVMAVLPHNIDNTVIDDIISEKVSATLSGRVFVDTRCLAFVDKDVILNKELMASFKELRLRNEEKLARDLLREHGAAIRYGFNQNGDELGVFTLPKKNQFAIWPDITS